MRVGLEAGARGVLFAPPNPRRHKRARPQPLLLRLGGFFLGGVRHPSTWLSAGSWEDEPETNGDEPSEKRYRTGGEQKVTVEHVHVHEGGQAIVGSVTGGGEVSKKEGGQPHA